VTEEENSEPMQSSNPLDLQSPVDCFPPASNNNGEGGSENKQDLLRTEEGIVDNKKQENMASMEPSFKITQHFEEASGDDFCPQAPPRYKRKVKIRGVANLNLENISNNDFTHQNDIFFRTDSLQNLAEETESIKGPVHLYCFSPSSLTKQWTPLWAVFDIQDCRMRIFKGQNEEEMVEEINIGDATFIYDLENSQNGEFKISTSYGEHDIDVGSSEKRLHWLNTLQKARRDYTSSSKGSSICSLQEKGINDDISGSPFKESLAPRIPTPRSAGYTNKKSFFQSIAQNPRLKLVRSESDRNIPPLKGEKEDRGKLQGFQALQKLRLSFRPQQDNGRTAIKELEILRLDLQASKDEAAASKEVVSALQKEMKTILQEKETLAAMQPQLAEGQLMVILREKDEQIVSLELGIKDKEREVEQLKEKIDTLEKELVTYEHIVEVKDRTIVKLTNDLHEFDLNLKMEQATPLTGSGTFVFSEKVSVGSQTDAEKQKESLQDTVTAFLMQNKFLNKEVLELNQLRQQAMDREQKLFLEASDWEARFYQIQSKYLLLLNELHNPQVMVSASRQEMVGHLLKDIVESSEKPALCTQNPEHDRYGFRFEENGSLLDKAERLQRIAQENLEETELTAEEMEKSWKDVVVALGRPGHFMVSRDMKNLIRKGVPINLRGTVWRAVIINRIQGNVEGQYQDYYQALLSNYNPGLTLSSAAKQIELDLLRTLPNNIHYDSTHAKGIPKLRRVLLAYSLHNPDIEYCQGFNRIAAIALLFLDEEDAFWCLVYIVEILMPNSYYTKQMTGAQVDQSVLKELLCEKLPRLSIHLDSHGVDPVLLSLNWFLCLFVDSLPVNTYLHIWDAFLFEGTKVLFRYAIAIFKSFEEKLLRQNDYMSIFNTFRAELDSSFDVKKLTKIAFHDLNPFPLRLIKNKREHHHKIIQAQFESLAVIREDYRKNSLKCGANHSPGYVQSDEEEDHGL